MTLELALYSGLVLHFVGDYLLQNDWMAVNKTRNSFACFVHCILYAAPFALILPVSIPLWAVFATHYVIDRYRLAQYWIRVVNWKWDGDNFGFADEKPRWMSVWLLIIVDNTFHILCNSAAIWAAYK